VTCEEGYEEEEEEKKEQNKETYKPQGFVLAAASSSVVGPRFSTRVHFISSSYNTYISFLFLFIFIPFHSIDYSLFDIEIL
jgi:hypothetical protein